MAQAQPFRFEATYVPVSNRACSRSLNLLHRSPLDVMIDVTNWFEMEGVACQVERLLGSLLRLLF